MIQEPQYRTVAELDLLFEKRVSARRFARFGGCQQSDFGIKTLRWAGTDRPLEVWNEDERSFL